MSSNKFKKLILAKKEGQSLLVILIISTLTMLLLIGVAMRIDIGRENIRRSGEFDRAFAASENALNDIISAVYGSNCIPTNLTTSEYKKIEGCENLDQVLAAEGADVFGKINEETIQTSINYPVSLNFGDPSDDSGVDLTGVRVKCGTTSQPDSRPDIKFIVTIVYVDTAVNEYKVLKGISNCFDVNANLSERGNIVMYNPEANVAMNPNLPPQTIYSNVKLIRLRLLDNSPSTNVSITGRLCNTSGQNCQDQGRTGSYDFMVVGLGGLGSDNIVKFEISKGSSDTDINPLFDFVYFGEDVP